MNWYSCISVMNAAIAITKWNIYREEMGKEYTYIYISLADVYIEIYYFRVWEHDCLIVLCGPPQGTSLVCLFVCAENLSCVVLSEKTSKKFFAHSTTCVGVVPLSIRDRLASDKHYHNNKPLPRRTSNLLKLFSFLFSI